MAWLAAGLVCVVVLVLYLVPQFQVKQLDSSVPLERRKELENEFRKTVTQALGGLLVIGGFLFTWQQILVSKEKETTDRFSQAIGYLGSAQAHVRMGGVYALGRVLRDYPKEEATVVDVLSAFIRENAPWEPEAMPRQLQPEIQAAMKVIGGRPRRQNKGKNDGVAFDLSDTDLRRGSFPEGNFAHVRMVRTHLESANLEGSDLSFAELQGSNLDRANFRGANLQGADLTGASVSETHFEGANLSGVTGVMPATLQDRSFLDSATVLP